MVECANPTRMNALDEALWTFRPDSFLPHMVLSDQIDMDELAEMPVLISDSQENPNNAQIRFYVEGAVPEKADNYERVVFMFNGHDPRRGHPRPASVEGLVERTRADLLAARTKRALGEKKPKVGGRYSSCIKSSMMRSKNKSVSS